MLIIIFFVYPNSYSQQPNYSNRSYIDDIWIVQGDSYMWEDEYVYELKCVLNYGMGRDIHWYVENGIIIQERPGETHMNLPQYAYIVRIDENKELRVACSAQDSRGIYLMAHLTIPSYKEGGGGKAPLDPHQIW
ncbi:hypothetical protein [Dysgonomonas massiliensis]|uniref:hypothetical protein n=1 Tax=Dysgonomonas massiliensis TaxID=2040292 RepID=UPI0011AFCBDB|nr:hypothetical protein [Dysgonomonas massiliensis]